MDSHSDLPITGICVVTDPNNTPSDYTVIDRTFDKSEDADLWKDGLFGRRTMRYLCVERSVPDMTKDVLIDVAFINEKDPIPPGFTVVENTVDTREKALKKKLLCGRWMLPSMTNDAITELIFLSRSTRKPPPGYTLVGETNNMALCYKMGRLAKPNTQPPQVQQPPPPQQATTVQGYTQQPFNMNPLNSNLPYPSNNSSSGGTATPRRVEASGSLMGTVNAPICGVPWQLNPRFQTLAELQRLTIPEIRYKSIMDIEREYEYDFKMERQAARLEPDRR
ncbi:multivesicular body subunit 12B-like [Babylonia areolata]|uniref:multivesicular body subunit 12B-like n=1 Tax=Babylonia areolata TaxID=304850 RepID=UPI003FD06F54